MPPSFGVTCYPARVTGTIHTQWEWRGHTAELWEVVNDGGVVKNLGKEIMSESWRVPKVDPIHSERRPKAQSQAWMPEHLREWKGLKYLNSSHKADSQAPPQLHTPSDCPSPTPAKYWTIFSLYRVGRRDSSHRWRQGAVLWTFDLPLQSLHSVPRIKSSLYKSGLWLQVSET